LRASTLVYLTPQGRVVSSRKANLIVREDGRVERTCEHGVGHPVGHIKRWQEWMGVHGCDGCCSLFDGN
jgi:hypothetical protein